MDSPFSDAMPFHWSATREDGWFVRHGKSWPWPRTGRYIFSAAGRLDHPIQCPLLSTGFMVIPLCVRLWRRQTWHCPAKNASTVFTLGDNLNIIGPRRQLFPKHSLCGHIKHILIQLNVLRLSAGPWSLIWLPIKVGRPRRKTNAFADKLAK